MEPPVDYLKARPIADFSPLELCFEQRDGRDDVGHANGCPEVLALDTRVEKMVTNLAMSDGELS